MTPWERFRYAARGEPVDRTPVALIVDSPWLPGYAGISTLDYFLLSEAWLRINRGLVERFPDVAWIPGFWVEFGMAAEPSAFGARVEWRADQPPSIEPVRGGLAALAGIGPADPQRHGLMPLVLHRYAEIEARLHRDGPGVRMVAARGPLAVAAWLLGFSEVLAALIEQPDAMAQLLDVLTETTILWLRAQQAVLTAPEGVLLLDDMAGMVSPRLFDRFVHPYYTRIFESFDGIKVFHNDTPCAHLVERIGALGMQVWNLSHEMDLADVHARIPHIALMGNVAPLAVMVRGAPGEVEAAARECIAKTNGERLILSAGGGVSPGTPAASIDALVRATLDGGLGDSVVRLVAGI